MDFPFLKSLNFSARGLRIFSGAALSMAVLSCRTFDDPLLEFDPSQNDSTLFFLADSEQYPVIRKNIFESFGSFGCVSCAYAEALLLPYVHPERNSPGYNPNLMVVVYHVKFGTIGDPWVTEATQARYDQNFSNSLPQSTLNGSNTPFGIRETGVRYDQGEYDSLMYRTRILDPLTTLDLRLDTAASVYDSATRIQVVRFTVFNRDTVSRSALSFRVLAVKNRPVKFSLNPDPWEIIVAETTERDTSGQLMTVGGFPPLSAKTFVANFTLIPEFEKNPPPPNPENPKDYALIVVAKDQRGIVQNVASFKYKPQ